MTSYNKHEEKDRAREYAHGVWGAMHTPFTPDGELDEEGLRATYVYLADDLKLSGVTWAAVQGEFWSLTIDERKRANEIVVEASRTRSCAPMAFTGHHSVKETIGLTRHAEEIGAAAVAITAPYFPDADERGIYRYFSEIAEAVNIGIWMVDTSPSNWRNSEKAIGRNPEEMVGGGTGGFSVDLTAELAKIPNIVGLKLFRGDEHYDALRARGVDKEIVLSDPDEGRWISLMKRGQVCNVAGPWSFSIQTPQEPLLNEYTAAGLRGDFEEAQAISDRMQPVRELFARTAVSNPGAAARWFKPWLEYMGIPAGPVRAPLSPLPRERVEALHEELAKVMPNPPRPLDKKVND